MFFNVYSTSLTCHCAPPWTVEVLGNILYRQFWFFLSLATWKLKFLIIINNLYCNITDGNLPATYKTFIVVLSLVILAILVTKTCAFKLRIAKDIVFTAVFQGSEWKVSYHKTSWLVWKYLGCLDLESPVSAWGLIGSVKVTRLNILLLKTYRWRPFLNPVERARLLESGWEGETQGKIVFVFHTSCAHPSF